MFRRHALLNIIKQRDNSHPTNQSEIIRYLKRINPTAKHHSRTWSTYAKKMAQWLSISGYLTEVSNGWIYEDRGDIDREDTLLIKGERKKIVFIGDSPPYDVIEALKYIRDNGPQLVSTMKSLGYRNACSVLFRFRIIHISDHCYEINENFKSMEPINCVWTSATQEISINYVIRYLKNYPNISSEAIGEVVGKLFDKNWTITTQKRVGNGLRQWACWLLKGEVYENIPNPDRLRHFSKPLDKTLPKLQKELPL